MKLRVMKPYNPLVQIINEEVETFIDEALSLSQAKAYTSYKNPEKYKEYDKVFGDQHRLYFDLNGNPLKVDKRTGSIETNQNGDSALLVNLNNILNPYDFEANDIKTATNKKNGQQIKIGKVLNKINSRSDDEGKKEIEKVGKEINRLKSAAGEGKLESSDNKLIVVSRHPYDIAGMSTDRDWKTCMNLVDGVMKSYVVEDVKHGTLVAYIIKKDDLNINYPINRFLMKPFHKKDDDSTNDILLFPESKTYGSAVEGDMNAIYKITDQINTILNPNASGLVYELNCNLYDDGEKERFNLQKEMPIEKLNILDDHDRSKYLSQINGKYEYIGATVFFYGGGNLSLAYVKDSSEFGNDKIFINKKGEPSVEGMTPKDMNQLSGTEMASYFNQKSGLNQYNYAFKINDDKYDVDGKYKSRTLNFNGQIINNDGVPYNEYVYNLFKDIKNRPEYKELVDYLTINPDTQNNTIEDLQRMIPNFEEKMYKVRNNREWNYYKNIIKQIEKLRF